MRRVLDGLASTVGVLLAIGWLGVMLLVGVGGITYRKDCVNSSAKIEKSWTAQWLPPIPFLLRPSEEGCKVHTGARVALNSVGLFKFKEQTVASAARDVATNPDLTDGQRYYADLYAAMQERQDYNDKHPDDLQGGIDNLRRTALALDAMSPPANVAADHNELRSLFRKGAADGEKMLLAIRAQDRDAVAALAPTFASNDRRAPQIIDRITKKLQAAEPDAAGG